MCLKIQTTNKKRFYSSKNVSRYLLHHKKKIHWGVSSIPNYGPLMSCLDNVFSTYKILELFCYFLVFLSSQSFSPIIFIQVNNSTVYNLTSGLIL